MHLVVCFTTEAEIDQAINSINKAVITWKLCQLKIGDNQINFSEQNLKCLNSFNYFSANISENEVMVR
jgi:hypothetical protein